MSKLIVLPETDPATTTLSTTDGEQIAAELGARGVRFERWDATASLSDAAGQDEVLAAYRADVDLLVDAGYTTVDVVRLHPDPDDPDWSTKAAEARNTFLAEHTHDDDEVRFFVEGSGAFYLRIGGEICIAVCEAGDLISVPKDTRHWFDMGTNPSFAAIRFFRIDDGWVGNFTGDDIATRFPTYDELVVGAPA